MSWGCCTKTSSRKLAPCANSSWPQGCGRISRRRITGSPAYIESRVSRILLRRSTAPSKRSRSTDERSVAAGRVVVVRRREFFASAAGLLMAGKAALSEPATVHYRRPPPYEPYIPLIEPGRDEFAEEKAALELTARVREWWKANGGRGEARFYALGGNLVRFEIKSPAEYRTGLWKVELRGERVASVTTVEEDVARSSKLLFRDVTGAVFDGVRSFEEQLSRGIPYWVARIDPAAGIDIYGSNGIAAGDIDNDGVDELYICQPGGLPNRLYKNAGGRFVDISAKAGVDILDDSSCALFLDVRNIGRQDLVLLRANGPALFLNNGDGVFRLKGDAFQFRTPPQGGFTGMAAADYDRDGKLDLYLCCYLFFQSEAQYRYPVPYHDARNGPPNFLFHNGLDADGNGAFTDVTAEVGLNHNNDRFSFAPAWCDYDGDGWPELYVANDFGRNNLYKNENGKFRDIAAEAGVEDIGPGMSAAWFDYDGDGRPDLYVSNMWSDAGQRVTAAKAFKPAQHSPELADAYRRHTKGNSLYRNLGNGRFEETGAKEQVEMGRWAWCSDAADFDNDGSPEILIGCGMLSNKSRADMMSFFWRQVVAKSPVDAASSAEYEDGWNAINQYIREDYSWSGPEPNVFYARRSGKYVDCSGCSGLDVAEDTRAFAFTDLDGDGNLDIVLKNRLAPQVRVFQNDCAGGRACAALRLRGTKSNRDAIGAIVEVDGRIQQVQAGSGFISQHTKTIYFRPGKPVKITWPSGLQQEFHDLPPGHIHTIVEGSQEVESTRFAATPTFAPAA